jgi:hypothetical protein
LSSTVFSYDIFEPKYTEMSFIEMQIDNSNNITLPMELPVKPIDNDQNFINFDYIAELGDNLSSPITEHLLDDNASLSDKKFYIDISSAMLSHLIRKLTNDHFNFLLLSADHEGQLRFGAELGVKSLSTMFIVNVRAISDDNTSVKYGLEFGLYPTENSSITIIHEDNVTDSLTGIKFKTNF